MAFTAQDNILVGDIVHVIFNKEVANLLGITKSKFISDFVLGSTTGLVNPATNGLPMYGNGEWSAKGSPIISVRRAVAKVQLKLDYNGGSHVEGDLGSTYTIDKTTYRLYQLSDIGYIDGSAPASTTSEPILINVSEDIREKSALMGDNYTGANYIFAYPYATKSIGKNPITLSNTVSSASRLAMIMKNEVSAGVFQYHRLDIYDHLNSEHLDIKSNNHYSVRVRKVSQRGYNTATEALNNPPSNVEYDLIVEDGDAAISNGQYLLNVGGEKEIIVNGSTGVAPVVELAKVVRVTSGSAPLNEPTPFSFKLDEAFFRVGDIAVTLDNEILSLGDEVKSVNVKVSGNGVIIFQYRATLGNIDYTSKPIKIISNGGVINIEGFVSGVDVANGYCAKEKFDIVVSKGYKFSVDSELDSEWDGSLTLNKAAVSVPSKFTAPSTKASISEVVSTGSNLNSFYLNVYRTAPGDADILKSFTAKVITTEGLEISHTFNVKITTSCRLAEKKDSYAVKIGSLQWADRNAGAELPTGVAGYKYELSQNHTNAVGHPDYNVENHPAAAIDKEAAAGHYYTYAQAVGACASFTLGGHKWRTPTYNEHDVLRSNMRYSKHRAYITVPNVAVGCFFPMAGWDGDALGPTYDGKTNVSCYLWSSNSSYRLFIGLNSSSFGPSSTLYGYSIRCVKA